MVDAILQIVFENFNSLIKEEIDLLWGAHEEIEKLSNTISAIRSVLKEAEVKQLENDAIKSWLKQLKDVAYDADDILDDYTTKALQSKVESQNKNCTKKVSNSFLSCITSNQVIFRHKIGKRIKAIRERLDGINNERSKFNLREGVVDNGIEVNIERETSSILTEPKIYGRDEDKEKIVLHLLNNVKNHEEVSIYPIIGMGGLGKTTLAQLVYNDEKIEKHFQPRIWVCVSEPFNVKRILKEAIESVGGDTKDLIHLALDTIQRRLQDILSGKRFLLVLDDVWNNDPNKWDTLKYSLTCGAKGSSIIVTTRMERVASIMGTLHAHHLLPLSDEDCWSLFKQRAFGVGSEEDSKLEAIGKEIVKKCGGVPLAAKALGSIMLFKKEEIEWVFVRESEIWDLQQGEVNLILPALRLSYNHLPSQLKQCFAYCSIFPKDYSMEKEELIHLWMANGFIQPNGRMLLEDIGNDIFNDLLWRSFFQNIEKDDDGNIIGCKMHDLMHDLARSVMADECCSIVDVGTPENLRKRIRHLSLVDDPSITIELPLKSQTIRTLLLKSLAWPPIKVPHSIFSYLKCIRVLDLSRTDISDLPDSIGKMKHLRYLNLSNTEMAALPESVSSLINLLILKLRYCHQLQKLPKHMRNMRSLRHLDISNCQQLTNMPVGMGQLIDLQTLSTFIVGKRKGCDIRELEGLNDLRGEVEIKGLENVRNSVEAKEAGLIRKQNLCSLGLYWGLDQVENSEEVLQGLQPHQNLRRLRIASYGGRTVPSWMGDSSLLNLVEITLAGWKRCEQLLPFGQLPHLKVLRIRRWDCVKYIGGNEFYGDGVVKGFPSLEELYFWELSNLEEWSKEEAGEVLPCLRRLSIGWCPKLTSLPLLPSLEHLYVESSNEVILRSLENLTSLSSFRIYRFDEMTSFPEGVVQNLTALQSLEFNSLSNLTTLPREIENLASLTSLKISDCGGLVSLPVELRNLTSLKSMLIKGCKALKSLPEEEEGIQGLCSLVSLGISNCDSLTSLSKGLRHLTALEQLRIIGCPELEPLASEDLPHLIFLRHLFISDLPKWTNLPEGLQHLTSLQSLYIWDCKNLTSLPEWLQHLTALQTLDIIKCPHLERRCERERGEDWHKISHIPNFTISTDY